jgi:hypothetical protein
MTPLLTGVFASQISGRLNTFTLAGNYDALSTVTVPAGGLSSVIFAGIPQTGYSHLQLRAITRGNNADVDDDIQILFNSDSSASYTYKQLSGNGTTVTSGGDVSQTTTRVIRATGATAAANIFGAGVVDILDYTNITKTKVLRTLNGQDSNGSGVVNLRSLLYNKTDAIHTMTLSSRYGSLISQHSQFALYGVKA